MISSQNPNFQPLVLELYSSLGSTTGEKLIGALPSLISSLNQQLVLRSTVHFSKYITIIDKCFNFNGPQTTSHLNLLRFKLLIELIQIVEARSLEDLLKLIYNIQNMIKFWDVSLVENTLLKLAEDKEENTLKYCTLIITKCCLFKPEIITKTLIPHSNCRYFSEMFLNCLNNPQSPHELKTFLKFIPTVYSSVDQFFYSNDLKVLVDILLRVLEHGYSQDVLERVLEAIISLSCCSGFKGLRTYRTQDLKQMVSLVKQKHTSLGEKADEILNIFQE